MGCFAKTLSLLVLFVSILIGGLIYISQLPETPPDPEFLKDRYWGKQLWSPGDPIPKDDTAIRPFKIEVEDAELVDLKDRLKRTRIQESFPGVNQEYGLHSDVLKKVVHYWLNSYDWRKQEKMLNTYPHFKTQVEGLDIHFIHVKSKKNNAVPLMLCHGWPGSFVEFTKMIPLLEEFDLVIPSIPGYGFSEASHKPGLHAFHISRIFVKLMNRLGYSKFVYHAGDWGAIIGRALTRLYPDNVIGFHTTMPIGPYTPLSFLRLVASDLGFGKFVFEDHVKEERRYGSLSSLAKRVLQEAGYLHIQATKPDTVGVALNNDPAGLAAYILEKFSTATNWQNLNKPDGGLTEKFSMDELLNNVMIYWITQTATSAARLYKEGLIVSFLDRGKVTVSTAALVGRMEVPMTLSQTIIKSVYKRVLKYTDLDYGGHFLAYEEPKLVANDIRDFVRMLIVE